jgi:hypothetical protein
MTHRKIKRPQSATSQRLTVPIPEHSPPLAGYPTFSLFHLQDSHCIRKCTLDEKASFAEALRALSKLTWNQIRSTPHLGLGSEKIERGKIHAAIPNSIDEDVSFIALRFHEKKPMVGFRAGNVFNIVWFDRDFTLYDHGN